MTHRRGRVRGLVVATHPAPTAVVTALAAGLLVGVGAPARVVGLATAAVLAGQLSVGWSNDWVDAARDVASDRTDKPVVTGAVEQATVRAAAIVAAAACVVLSLATGWLPGLVHLVAVAAAWSYNLRLKDSIASFVPYGLAFGLLPVFLWLALPGGQLAPAWVVVAGALLGVGAHLANAVPDLEADVASGVRGLPHRLGRRRSALLAPLVLGTGACVAAAGPPGPPAAWVVGVAGAAVLVGAAAGATAVLRPRSRAPFSLSMLVAGLSVVLMVAAGPVGVDGSVAG